MVPGQSPEETRHKLPRVLSWWSLRGHITQFLQQQDEHMCVIFQGSSLETQCPGISLAAGWLHKHPLSSMHQIQTPRKNANMQSKPHCLYKVQAQRTSHSDSFVSVQGTVYQLSLQMPAKSKPCKLTILRTAALGLPC